MSRALLKFIESVCVQRAWYWAGEAKVPDGFGGFTYDEPTLIKCRWDDKTELIRAANGEQVVSRAQILVIDDLEVGATVQLFANEEEPPAAPSTLGYDILRIEKNPMFRSTDQFVRVVYV